MADFLAHFHFIRPLCLLAIFALLLAIWLLKKITINHSGWQKVIPNHLTKVLLDGQTKTTSPSLVIPFVIGLLAIIALAGPSWQKLPQPVYQVERGSVIIMDMSYSMYATDLTPNRLTRARYKAVDLLEQLNEGDIGLIAYAGDAFVISPLTQDINNIKLLLPSLSPDLMPVLGSNPLPALYLADEMLTNAGHLEGDIYWFTDGIDKEDIEDINQWNKDFPHRLNVLGVGTSDGAPITLGNGELMKDDSGAIVIPKLSEQFLYGVASQGDGVYQTLTNDISDIENLVRELDKRNSQKQSEQQVDQQNTGDQWQEAGPYLVLLILPLLLGYFRRGSLVCLLPLMFSLSLIPQNQAYAVDWQDLWQTKDQQGQKAFSKQEYASAAENFENPMWQGSAHFKAGNYQEALDAFKQVNSPQALYNQGNALAKLNQLDEAIAAYQKALELDPQLQDAKDNKALVERLKQQQESQQNQDNQNQQEGEQSSDDDQQQGDQKGEQQQSESSSDSQQQDQQGQQQDQSSEQQNSSQNNQQNGEQSENQPSEQPEQADKSAEEQQDENEQAQAKQQQANEAKDGEQSEQQSQQAQLAQEQIDQEKAQKHQQLLKRVTDDPYLLLRNKMQLEYQKRRQNGSNSGVKKKW